MEGNASDRASQPAPQALASQPRQQLVEQPEAQLNRSLTTPRVDPIRTHSADLGDRLKDCACNPRTAVAAGIRGIIVGLGMDYEGGAIAINQRRWAGRVPDQRRARQGNRRAQNAIGGDFDVRQSPMCGPAGLFMPCLRAVGFQWSPALAKSGASQRPTAWTCRPCTPCGRPAASMRKVTPPAVCQARTLPIDWPAELTSATGDPPSGSTAAQAFSAKAIPHRKRLSTPHKRRRRIDVPARVMVY